ncbi:MAG: aldo/keto reductase [Dehalococcoidia bacterium]|nr:aldo/keto reductase [Dehalococcoidia bacterium]
MEYRELGGSGLSVSAVGLGGGNFGWFCDEAQSLLVIRRALELGVNFIDTADVYGESLSEQFIGKAVAGHRHEVILATKVGHAVGPGPENRGMAIDRVVACCEASLTRLGTDYIDLYYLHQPDPETPLEETLGAFDRLVRQGKVRYIGISNYLAYQARDLLAVGDRQGYRAPVVSQNRYNLIERQVEAKLLPFCREKNLGLVPYFPLASGILTGKYRAGEPAPPGTRGCHPIIYQWSNHQNFALVAALDSFARRRDHTVGELAIAWLLAHPEVPSVIPGATKPEQVAANVAAANWKLTPQELSETEAILARWSDD